MYENTPPSYLPPPARASGMGCFAKGCLTVLVVCVLVVVMVGAVGWYVARGVMPFVSQRQATIKVLPATDAQYGAVRQKLAPFAQAVSTGHGATVALTADDINVLIARDPALADLRGKAYLSIAHNELSTESSFPFGDTTPGRPPPAYVNARVFFDASFANGDFTFVVRRVEPLDGGPTPGLVEWLIGHKDALRNLSAALNENLHERINRDPAQAELLGRLQTVIVKDNEIVATALDSPTPVATPANPP